MKVKNINKPYQHQTKQPHHASLSDFGKRHQSEPNTEPKPPKPAFTPAPNQTN